MWKLIRPAISLGFFTWALSILGMGWGVSQGLAQDVAGGADHPEIGRLEGSRITSYDQRDYDEYELPTGPAKGKVFSKSEILEGKTYRISYAIGKNLSIVEVMKNFEHRLTERGFEILYTCKAKDCGLTNFRYALDTIPLPHMQIDSFKYRYLAAKKTDSGQSTYASILVSMNNKKVFAQVYVVEVGEIAFRIVEAGEMASAIADGGRVALYGIYFDTNEATIKPDSRPTLDEIARFLAASPDLQVIVVGHTDNQGALDYNMDLSQRRSAAVMEELIQNYGVSPARLSAHGVGFLAPVASNSNEEGRAKNRRVELVAR